MLSSLEIFAKGYGFHSEEKDILRKRYPDKYKFYVYGMIFNLVYIVSFVILLGLSLHCSNIVSMIVCLIAFVGLDMYLDRKA